MKNDLEQLKKYQTQGKKDCPLCAHWLLGCLNGRKTWKDKAVTPNFRDVGKRMFCDAFEWDPNPERLGRVLYK